MSDDVVIAVRGVYKDFKLPHQRVNSIKSIFTGIHKKRTKSFETQHALKDISFEVKKGEFFGIVGRNGSGKSTLLKIIAEIYQPTKGNLQKSGKLVPFIELGVGFNPELTGRENVYLNGALLGFSVKEIDEQYDDIVGFAELEPYMDQKLKNYSSGMQVRLAFSVATRAKADILLIDEVLAVGDAAFQRKCFEYFRSLKKNKKTVVFVSHDMNAVREYCDRAVLIEGGKLAESGESDVVAAAYARLFVEDSGEPLNHDNTETKRWGTKTAYFSDVKLSKRQLTDEDYAQELTLTVKADEDVEEVVVGFFIKNTSGASVLGTNSRIMKHRIPQIKKGQSLQLIWTIPNLFSEGTYHVTAALETGLGVGDWWEELATFKVISERNTPYIISPPVELTHNLLRNRP